MREEFTMSIVDNDVSAYHSNPEDYHSFSVVVFETKVYTATYDAKRLAYDDALKAFKKAFAEDFSSAVKNSYF